MSTSHALMVPRPFLAAVKGHAVCIAPLLSDPMIDVNHRNDLGATAVFLAVVHNHTDCLEALLTHPGTDITLADRDGTTPLEVAEDSESEKCAELLRAHSAAALEARSPTGVGAPAVAVE